MQRRGFFSREAASFACAFRGIAALLKSEVHARIHLAASVTVLGQIAEALEVDPAELLRQSTGTD